MSVEDKISNMLNISKEQATTLLNESDNDINLAISKYYERQERINKGMVDMSTTHHGGPDNPDTYYVGGGDSGLAVLNPGRDPLDMFRGRGRGRGLIDRGRGPGLPPQPKPYDWGQGTSLGKQGQPGSTIGKSIGIKHIDQEPRLEKQKLIITFYQNGFIIGDETDLRNPNDPEQQRILKEMQDGFIPPEILKGRPNEEVEVIMERKNKIYKPPSKPKVIPFSGEGQSLNSTKSNFNSYQNYQQGLKRLEEISEKEDVPAEGSIIMIRFPNGQKKKIIMAFGSTILNLRQKVIKIDSQLSTKTFKIFSQSLRKNLENNQSCDELNGELITLRLT